ncbi:AraC family transcriptional regulator [Archangium sp.]|uniref:AraC family transcriptional regulator n=1 Tax=Archangium sp. TaxID=1872627 RepID=UPI002869ED94|nr:AraC family transcriptional regulator [Archangium sp.]
MPRAWIHLRGAAGLIRSAAARGLDPERLWALLGAQPSAVEDPDATVDLERVYDVWEAFYEQVKDPGLAIEVTRSGRRPPNDILLFSVMTSPTFGAALDTAVRFLRMRATSFQWERVSDEDGGAWLVQHRPGEDRIGRRLAIEATQAEFVAISRGFSGMDWTPTEVRFEHPPLGPSRAHQEFFRGPVKFGEARNAVGMEGRLLARAMPKGDVALSAYFQQQVEGVLRKRGEAEPEELSEAVRRLVMRDAREVPSLEEAARQLSMSGRTLRRRLEAEGTRYQELVDEVRAAISKRHLGLRGLAVGEVAYLVGFSEPSAFHRAFKRWTGMTPQEFRTARWEEARP